MILVGISWVKWPLQIDVFGEDLPRLVQSFPRIRILEIPSLSTLH